MGTPKLPGKAKFPLWLHKSRQWCKRYRGRCYYFGSDKDAALKRFVAEWDDIQAQREPKSRANGTTVAFLASDFLNAKRERVEAGELTQRSWAEYHATCLAVAKSFGKARLVSDLRTQDFAKLRTAMSKKYGPVPLGNFIQRVRTVFKYGFEAELIEVPIRFGPGFKKPARRIVRLQRADNALKLIEPADLRTMIAAAGSPLDAMILLGLNAGFGQTDCSELPQAALAAGWIDFRRPKTGTARRVPLWPETRAALDVAIRNRPEPIDKAHAGLVFVTRFGRQFVRFTAPDGSKPGHRIDGIGQEFAKLVRKLNLDVSGGFYTLRHVHRTVADEVLDHVAAGLIMGHVDDSMAGQYREKVNPDRLLKVANYVREWLYGKA